MCFGDVFENELLTLGGATTCLTFKEEANNENDSLSDVNNVWKNERAHAHIASLSPSKGH